VRNRGNCFDIIRHIAALLVLISHHFVLSGKAEPIIPGYNSLGGIAVISFFAISGFLITRSFIDSSCLKSYAIKRIARIFPALIMCAFVMVYVMGSVPAFGGGASYVTTPGALIDFLRISVMGRADIQPLTAGLVFSESLNGSLWTLKIEFALYCVTALALVLVRKPLVPLLMILALCVVYSACSASQHPLAAKLAIYSIVSIAFWTGSLMHFLRQGLYQRSTNMLVTIAALVIMIVAFKVGLTWILATISFSLLTLTLGTILTDRLIKSRFDISYGLYLYAFPIQQLVINHAGLGFYQSMLISAVLTTVFASASWVFVEKPVLSYARSKYGSTKLQASEAVAGS
jgi:peptidoglycan/LPS O-acetylase OafA/YrhL